MPQIYDFKGLAVRVTDVKDAVIKTFRRGEAGKGVTSVSSNRIYQFNFPMVNRSFHSST